jgi:outer membrane protein TolC
MPEAVERNTQRRSRARPWFHRVRSLTLSLLVALPSGCVWQSWTIRNRSAEERSLAQSAPTTAGDVLVAPTPEEPASASSATANVRRPPVPSSSIRNDLDLRRTSTARQDPFPSTNADDRPLPSDSSRPETVGGPPYDPDFSGPVPRLTAPAVPAAPLYSLSLSGALLLAQGENPNIAEARLRIDQALALQQGARALLLPSLHAGFNYHFHAGQLQRSSGRILGLTEESFYIGGGARTLAAETVSIPAVQIFSPLTDAIFEPLAARQRVDSARFQSTATTNAVLLDVSALYMDLAGAEALLAANRRSASEAEEITRVNLAYARVGQRPPADGERSLTELHVFHGRVQRSEERVAVASARLIQRLHLDQSVRIQVQGISIQPITLVDPASDANDLVRFALRSRPEMGARGADIAAAEVHVHQEKARPFLPTVNVGFSGGVLGGGSDLVLPRLANFASRTDFDAYATWQLQNFGFGNLARIRNGRAAVGRAEAERSKTMNTIRREILEAYARSKASELQIQTTRRSLVSSMAGYGEDLTRARGAVGRPIEVFDSLKLLAQARQEFIDAIVAYDKAQLALFVALGTPPPMVKPTNVETPATAPVAFPSLRQVDVREP